MTFLWLTILFERHNFIPSIIKYFGISILYELPHPDLLPRSPKNINQWPNLPLHEEAYFFTNIKLWRWNLLIKWVIFCTIALYFTERPLIEDSCVFSLLSGPPLKPRTRFSDNTSPHAIILFISREKHQSHWCISHHLQADFPDALFQSSSPISSLTETYI